MIELFGMQPYKAVEFSKKLFGGSPEDTSAPAFGIGLADLMGLGEIFAMEEGLDQAERGNIIGDKGDELMGTGMFLAGSIAPAVVLKKIVGSPQARKFLQEAKDRWDAGKSPIPVGMSIENVGDAAKLAPDAPPFYSAVAKAVDALPQDKGSGDQMRAMITKGEGVKPDEMAWIGLDDFLKGKKSVTKQEIKDYVEANQVRIEEVVKSDAGKFEIRPDDDGFTVYLNGKPQKSFANEKDAIEEVEGLKSAHFDMSGNTKFGGPDTTLPGGENYRELLLRLPERPVSRVRYAIGPDANNRRASNATTREEAIAEAGGDASQVTEIRDRNTVDPNFTKGHYDESNVLAHVRLNDRTGPNGEKILFVEEIQSDWHQKARGIRKIEIEELAKRENITEEEAAKRVSETIGYADPERMAELKARRAEILNERDVNKPKWLDRYEELDKKDEGLFGRGDSLNKKEQEEFATLSKKYLKFTTETKALLKEIDSEIASRAGAVPDAPLKKNWHEMSFRRIARMAAEEGYDVVSWTPGKMQAERYNLSKQVSELRAIRHEDGTFSFGYVPPEGGNRRQLRAFVPESELDELIGKDMAEKVKGQNQETVDYSGVDLEVGGKGMKGFYDKMVKNYAQKWGKKFGAKVGMMKLATKNFKRQRDYGISPDPDGGYMLMSERTEAQQVANILNDEIAPVRGIETLEEAQELLGQFVDLDDIQEVWSMKITQKMRDSLMKTGVSTFGLAGAASTVGMQGQDNGT
jgi:hypothetical protein